MEERKGCVLLVIPIVLILPDLMNMKVGRAGGILANMRGQEIQTNFEGKGKGERKREREREKERESYARLKGINTLASSE